MWAPYWAHMFYKLEALGALMGSLEFFLFKLCSCLFFYLMLSLSFILWMKLNVQWLSHWNVKLEFISNEGPFSSYFLFCIWSGGIYYIILKNLVWIHVLFLACRISYVFVFVHKVHLSRGSNFIVTQACHLGFQQSLLHGVFFIGSSCITIESHFRGIVRVTRVQYHMEVSPASWQSYQTICWMIYLVVCHPTL
jgi:hypothetical protein